MTISKWTFAGAVGTALLVGLLLGRYASPDKVVESDHIVETTRDTELRYQAYVGRTDTRFEKQVEWHTTTRWLPSGEVVQDVRAQADEKIEKTEQAVKIETAARQADKRVDIGHVKIIESKQIDWIFTGRAGVTLQLTMLYGLEIQRRILGPVFFGGWVERPWAGGLGLALELRGKTGEIDWFFAGRAGFKPKWSLVYGGDVRRRILGPVFAGVWFQKPWAGGLGFSLAF